MNTMHHRKGGLSGSQRGDDAAAVTVKRRRKATSSLLRSGRNELLIAVVFTAVLTSIAVLTVVKLLASSVATTTPTTATPPMTDQAGKQRAAARRQSEQKHEEAAGNVLPWNPKYVVPESMTVVGDRSDAYVELRKATDAQYSYDPTRSLSAVQELVQSNTYLSFQAASMDVHHSDQVPYDINNCPETPPVGYPFAWNMLQILDNWGPDDTKPPASGLIFQGLCVFDYVRDYAKALTYRDLELPFVVINDPEVAVTVERWNRPGYMEKLMGSVMHRVEYSENNHFMYYVPQPKTRRNTVRRNNNQVPADWKPPTQMGRMTYDNWLRNANVTDDKLGPNNPHWYYRLIGCGSMGNDGSCDQGSSEFLFDEMTFFQPKPSLYIVEPEEQKGIHCRFGMKGVIAENHFDGSRNAIVVLGGSRRYILTHPNQCDKLALYPKGHPSSRHSAVDWSNPDLVEFPQFSEAVANEVVLTPGQVLYLPTEWFHYIISLELNFQCNTRSGITDHYKEDITRCGF